MELELTPHIGSWIDIVIGLKQKGVYLETQKAMLHVLFELDDQDQVEKSVGVSKGLETDNSLHDQEVQLIEADQPDNNVILQNHARRHSSENRSKVVEMEEVHFAEISASHNQEATPEIDIEGLEGLPIYSNESVDGEELESESDGTESNETEESDRDDQRENLLMERRFGRQQHETRLLARTQIQNSLKRTRSISKTSKPCSEKGNTPAVQQTCRDGRLPIELMHTLKPIVPRSKDHVPGQNGRQRREPDEMTVALGKKFQNWLATPEIVKEKVIAYKDLKLGSKVLNFASVVNGSFDEMARAGARYLEESLISNNIAAIFTSLSQINLANLHLVRMEMTRECSQRRSCFRNSTQKIAGLVIDALCEATYKKSIKEVTQTEINRMNTSLSRGKKICTIIKSLGMDILRFPNISWSLIYGLSEEKLEDLLSIIKPQWDNFLSLQSNKDDYLIPDTMAKDILNGLTIGIERMIRNQEENNIARIERIP